MTIEPKTHVNPDSRLTRRTIVAAALGTSALAYAAVRSGVVGGTSQPGDDGSVKVVNASGQRSDISAGSASDVSAAATTSDLDILRSRHSNMLTGAGSYDKNEAGSPYAALLAGLDDQVTQYGKTLNVATDRTYLWNDAASGTGVDNMVSSFVRLRAMIIQWASPGSAHYNSPTVLAKVTSGLSWLSANRYTASVVETAANWWQFQIGSPLAALDALAVLIEGGDATDWSTILASIGYWVAKSDHFEGGNAVWLTRGRLLHSIVAKDTGEFQTAYASVKARLAYVANDANGFRPDNSFVEHHTSASYPGFAYTGGYGIEAFFNCAWMTYLLAGSPNTVLPPANVAVMTQWAVGAFEPFLYRGAIPGAVMGRNVSRNYYPDHYVGAVFLGSAVLLSAVAASADAATLKSIFNTHVATDTARPFFDFDGITGLGNLTMHIMSLGFRTTKDAFATRADPDATYVFPLMDRVVQRRPGWAFTVANSSTRVLTFEAINKENIRGWYQGQGMTYFYNQYSLSNYLDAFWPTVDPKRLPGTTIDNRDRSNPPGSTSTQLSNQPGGSSLVGGVGDANCGAAMMTVDTDSGAMKARKSWIFLGDFIVCQGSGITNNSGYAVETVVENRNLGANGTNAVQMNSTGNAVLTTSSSSDQSLGSANWVHVDGIGGYVFPAGTSLFGRREQRMGAWSDINTRDFTPKASIGRNYVTLFLSHGSNISNKAYSYVFMPNASALDTANAFANATVARQAKANAHTARVVLGTQSVWGAVFWQSDMIDIFTASAPVCVIVRQTNGHIAISVCDPSQAATGPVTINVSIPNSGLYNTPGPGLTVTRTLDSATLTFDPSQLAVPGSTTRAILNV